MGYRYRLLADENVEAVESDLHVQGHDVKRIENVPKLGDGADDREDIVPSPRRTGRIILTYDSHFPGQASTARAPRRRNPADRYPRDTGPPSRSGRRLRRLNRTPTSFCPSQSVRKLSGVPQIAEGSTNPWIPRRYTGERVVNHYPRLRTSSEPFAPGQLEPL